MKELLIELQDDIERTKVFLDRLQAFQSTQEYKNSCEEVQQLICDQIEIEKMHIHSQEELQRYYESL